MQSVNNQQATGKLTKEQLSKIKGGCCDHPPPDDPPKKPNGG